jgi:hypothetical protein
MPEKKRRPIDCSAMMPQVIGGSGTLQRAE